MKPAFVIHGVVPPWHAHHRDGCQTRYGHNREWLRHEPDDPDWDGEVGGWVNGDEYLFAIRTENLVTGEVRTNAAWRNDGLRCESWFLTSRFPMREEAIRKYGLHEHYLPGPRPVDPETTPA